MAYPAYDCFDITGEQYGEVMVGTLVIGNSTGAGHGFQSFLHKLIRLDSAPMAQEIPYCQFGSTHKQTDSFNTMLSYHIRPIR